MKGISIEKTSKIGFFCLVVFLVFPVQAKKYRFSIESHREVAVSHSTKAGSKMLNVVAYGKSADAAIDQAMVDAVAAMIFEGAKGQGEMGSCPAVLLNGREVYQQNKSFFDKFFKKGCFLKYVEKVNSTYPQGADNVKTKKGRRIQILLIVNWRGLANYLKENGFKTIVSELSNY
jgi:hypothetical protein